MEGGGMSRLAFLAAFLAASVVFGQIDVPPETALHKPITARLTNPIPAGAQVQGAWNLPTADFLPAVDGIHIWAPAGTHKLSYRGIWIKTRPITIDGQTVQVLEGFGFIDESASFKVGGGPDPGPDPPVPPNPGGPKELMLFYEADQLDNYPEPQRRLLTSLKLREELTSAGHLFYRVIEAGALEANVAGSGWEPWFAAVKGDPMPRAALRNRGGGPVTDVPLPADKAALLKLLESN
jgi:hypothetical protein